MITIKFTHHLMNLDENVASQKFGSTFPIKKYTLHFLFVAKKIKTTLTNTGVTKQRDN